MLKSVNVVFSIFKLKHNFNESVKFNFIKKVNDLVNCVYRSSYWPNDIRIYGRKFEYH